jgi:hypothetical protein
VQALLPLDTVAPCPLCGRDAPAIARINRRVRYRCESCGMDFELLGALPKINNPENPASSQQPCDNGARNHKSPGTPRNGPRLLSDSFVTHRAATPDESADPQQHLRSQHHDCTS